MPNTSPAQSAEPGKYDDMNLYLRPGLRFAGRKDYAGLHLTVLSVEPETDEMAGSVAIRVDHSTSAELEVARSHLKYVRERFPGSRAETSAAECLDRLESPHEAEREINWFRQWLRNGLIVEVHS